MSYVLSVLLALSCVAPDASDRTASMTQKMLCVQQGYLEFVEYRSRADVLVRFVNAGEDARISLVERPMRPGEWGVARRGRRVNAVRAYIVQWAGQDVIDVRIVQSTPGCS